MLYCAIRAPPLSWGGVQRPCQLRGASDPARAAQRAISGPLIRQEGFSMSVHPGTSIRSRRVRALAVAFTCALALTVPAVPGQAAPVDPGVRCAARIGPGEYEFYLPGAKVTDKDGVKW